MCLTPTGRHESRRGLIEKTFQWEKKGKEQAMWMIVTKITYVCETINFKKVGE